MSKRKYNDTDGKVHTFLVPISGVVSASLLIAAESEAQAEAAASAWLESHRPEKHPGTAPSMDEWDVDIGSTDLWRDEVLPEAIVAADVAAGDGETSS